MTFTSQPVPSEAGIEINNSPPSPSLDKTPSRQGVIYSRILGRCRVPFPVSSANDVKRERKAKFETTLASQPVTTEAGIEIYDSPPTPLPTADVDKRGVLYSRILGKFPVPGSSASDVFTSQPVTTDAGIDISKDPPSPSRQRVLISTDSENGEVVEVNPAVKFATTDSTASDDEEENDYDRLSSYDDNGVIAGQTGRKRSVLKSPACIIMLATLLIATVAFLASHFISHPRRGEGGPQNVDTNGYNETNATQIETEEDTSSTVIMMGTISPSTGSPTESPFWQPSLLPTPPPTPQIESIALEAVEDTFIFIMTSQTQMQAMGRQPTLGQENDLRVKGGDEVIMITIIRFDTTPLVDLEATVVSAKLSLFPRTDSVFGGQINLASDDCDWNENDISWANAPDCILDTGADLLGRFGEVVRNERVEADLDLAWRPMQIPTQVTLLISSDNDDGVTYSSRNDMNGPGGPRLIVEYYI